jgi:deoxyribose-phosphate aldolase
MLEAVRDFYLQTGKKIGVKPAGGIRQAKQAWHYLVMVKETLGDAWLQPDLFRLGASSLLNDILMQIERLESGAYQSPIYFSED